MTRPTWFIPVLLHLGGPLGAQPVVSPPAEMLIPPVNGFPRPGSSPALSDTWETLTAGTNLALGRPYRFDRKHARRGSRSA